MIIGAFLLLTRTLLANESGFYIEEKFFRVFNSFHDVSEAYVPKIHPLAFGQSKRRFQGIRKKMIWFV